MYIYIYMYVCVHACASKDVCKGRMNFSSLMSCKVSKLSYYSAWSATNEFEIVWQASYLIIHRWIARNLTFQIFVCFSIFPLWIGLPYTDHWYWWNTSGLMEPNFKSQPPRISSFWYLQLGAFTQQTEEPKSGGPPQILRAGSGSLPCCIGSSFEKLWICRIPKIPPERFRQITQWSDCNPRFGPQMTDPARSFLMPCDMMYDDANLRNHRNLSK